MERMFREYTLDKLVLANRFVYAPMKTGFASPKGIVTEGQLRYHQQIAKNGPGIFIEEPYAVASEARETPLQYGEDRPNMAVELTKLVDVIHSENRLACFHLNHAGAAANPKFIGAPAKSASVMKCFGRGGHVAEALTIEEIQKVLNGFRSSAQKGAEAGFDLIEIQTGHGYLVHQFLNPNVNQRADRYGQDRLLFAREVIAAVKEGAPGMPFMIRISGNDMSPEFGISQEHDLKPLLNLALETCAVAVHIGMGTACFSPPWYLHHPALPEKPQLDALAWVRKNTSLPLIVTGRMDNKEKVLNVLDEGLADLVGLGRPLIADPDIIGKWQEGRYEEVRKCGYCLQGCHARLTTGLPSGCNVNPEFGQHELKPSSNPMKVLVAGGGPAGISAGLYLSKRGHHVTLVEKEDHLGGQFSIAWQAPAKENMKNGLDYMEKELKACGPTIMMEKSVDADLVKEIKPDLLVWATGAVQNIPEIENLHAQYTMTSLEYFRKDKDIHGPRVLVIGAGRTGLEIAEILGSKGFEVVATKRTDPIGGGMPIVSRNIILKKIEGMSNVTLMPHTTVISFDEDRVAVEQDGEKMSLEPFQTIILASGMVSMPEPDEEIQKAVSRVEIIGDANDVSDIFSGVQDGYHLALEY